MLLEYAKVRAIFVKEMRDSLRDRRTLFATIIVPVLLYPLMLLGLGEAVKSAQAKRASDTYRVAVEPPEALALLQSIERLKLEEAPHGPEVREPDKPRPGAAAETAAETLPKLLFEAHADAREKLNSGEIQAILVLPARFQEAVASTAGDGLALEDVPVLELLFDQAEHRSGDAVRRLTDFLARFDDYLVGKRLERQGLGSGFLMPFRWKAPQNVAPAEKIGGGVLGSTLPLIFIMMIIAGSTYPAIDLTAGEKERSTLETLISAPVRPLEVIAGKFLTVAALALLSAFLNVASFGLTFFSTGIDRLAGLSFPWQALPATLVVLIPLTLFFAALLLAVSSFATSSKEAQVYCLPVYMVPMLGLMIITVPGIELNGPLLVAPVVNTALLIKELLLGHTDLGRPFAFVFVSTCLYAVAAVALAARVFAREEVLFSAQGSLRLLIGRRFFRPRAAPQASDALLVLALLFPIHFYFSAGLARLLPAGGTPSESVLALVLALPQLAVLLGLPALACWYLRANVRRTFLWRAPAPRAAAAALLLGGSSWILAAQFVAWQGLVWPAPRDSSLERLEEILRALSPAGALVLFALLPAFCEEHCFRGFLLSSLRMGAGNVKGRRLTAVLLSGLFFGVFHYSLYKQPITSLLGFALGFLAWESRSLWPGVVVHLLHNGLSIRYGAEIFPMTPKGEPAGGNVSLRFLLPALAAFAVGLLLARGSGDEGEDGERTQAGP